MFITKKHIPRRTFLKGVGTTLALPLLEAMVPAQTALAQTAAGPIARFAGIWHPHGASPGYWSLDTLNGPEFVVPPRQLPQPFVDLRGGVCGLGVRHWAPISYCNVSR